ncbi:LuxR C-terminal-related transcriptional regulator [Nocardioides sp. AE5]|uniref:ATP-binding protein n=1 Tax=Nocardioides sp. AE5 TaxID=2962573 RepID=UPI0028827781|nr:LuxR C-terminal-related transcriptional regulator [Nocardioides sp. AE5]MDT0203066.1 LuxR C-terminal-related transcriptional regulator [Nocardioides sp. AE5]
MQAAREADPMRSDGVRLVLLAEIRNGALIGHAVNAALGIMEGTAHWQLSTLAKHIGEADMLLVLDNCEHVADEAGQLASALLHQCSRLRILTTSRQPLNVGGETVLSVPPLAGSDPAAPSAHNEALQFFLDRARAAVPGLVLSRQDEALAAELCRLLDGIPLALELAAVRLRSLPLDDLVRRMENRYALLTQGSRTAPARHQTLHAAIEGTEELCTPAERLLWQRLSVFSGGFTIDAAEAVAHGDGVDLDAVLDLVAGLVDKSVLTITVDPAGGRHRYRMLQTLCEYGAAALSEKEDAQLRRRHLEWFVALARRAEAEWSRSDQVAWLRQLRAEHPNLQMALETAMTIDPTAGIELVVGIENYWLARGFLSEAREWLARFIAAAPPRTPTTGRGLRLDAWLAVLQGDQEAAEERLAQAAELVGHVADPVLEALLIQAKGLLALFGGNLDEARVHLATALTRFEQLDHLTGRVHTLFELGLANGLAGDHDEAFEWHRRCRSLAIPHGESWWHSFSLWALGVEHWRRGDLVAATALQQDSLRLKRALGDHLGIGVCLEAMAWIAVAESDGQRAARLLGAADTVLERAGMPFAGIQPMWQYHVEGENSTRRLLTASAFRDCYAAGARLSIEEAVDGVIDERGRQSAVSHEASRLTRREMEVAELIARGCTNRDIASHLVLSVRTVEKHVDHILRKLGADNRAQVVRWVTEQEQRRAPK